MTDYSIGCDEHVLSDCRFFGPEGVWFDTKREASERAAQQTALHQALGMPCVFIVREREDKPTITEDEVQELLAEVDADEAYIRTVANVLPNEV